MIYPSKYCFLLLRKSKPLLNLSCLYGRGRQILVFQRMTYLSDSSLVIKLKLSLLFWLASYRLAGKKSIQTKQILSEVKYF